MKTPLPYTLNLGGRLMDLGSPKVMAIVNVTPDSFYAGSRTQTAEAIRRRVHQVVAEGADMIDLGAYSSRPGADDVSADEEMRRLSLGLEIIRSTYPDMPVSIDTFRASVARRSVEEYGAHIINDISGGQADPDMFDTVVQLGVPYILMHMKGTPQTMQQSPHYDHLVAEMLQYFSRRVQALRDRGVKDIIIDPGFGFAKTLDHNYELMAHLEDFHMLELPLLVGISRKSMIYRLLDTTPAEALNGTTVLNTLALEAGASILRVHDVKPCVEVVRMMQKWSRFSPQTSNTITSYHK